MSNRSKYDEKVQVTVRCRPMNQSERQRRVKKVVECNSKSREVTIATSTTSIGLTGSHQTKSYSFDKVFGTNATQLDVYKSVIESQLQDVLAGYNCTVLAYGQTGTGKTYTMEGERSVDENYSWDTDPRAGIIPRALSQLFDCLERAGNDFSVRVSLLEIYNEEIYDLLSSSNDMLKMKIYEDNCRKGSVVVSGLTEVHVRHKSDVYNILQQGATKRRTAATNLNEFSSRSHSVFSVTVHTKDVTHNNMEEEELVKIGKLNLVDLAGSENIGRSGAVDKRAREAGNINQSLLTLGRCITALVDRAPHIPYRESKLTRLLQDSLGGATKTSIIATISPGGDNFEETMSTLDYAARAKNIHNKPRVNQKLTKRALIKEYDDEIERLRREVVAMREKNGVYVDPQRYDEMVAKIEELTAAVKHREEEIAKLEELFTTKSDQLASCTEKLHILEHDLEETCKELAEQYCIKNAHVEHGQDAVNYASSLLATANDVTADIEEVHNKVDRVKRTHEKNIGTFTSFTKRLKNDTDSMCSETVLVIEQNKINIQTTMESVEKFQQTQYKAMDVFSSGFFNIGQLTKDMQTDSLSKFRSWLLELDDQCGQQNELVIKITAAFEEHCEKSKEKLQQIDDITKTFAQRTEAMKKYSNALCSQVEERMQLTMLNTQQIQKDLHDMNEFVDREEKLRRELQADMVKQMERLQDEMMKKTKEIAANILHQTEECDARTSGVRKEKSGAVIEAASCLNDDMTKWGSDVAEKIKSEEMEWIKSLGEGSQTIKNCMRENMELMTSSQCAVEEIGEDASSVMKHILDGGKNIVISSEKLLENTFEETKKICEECELVMKNAKKDSDDLMESISESTAALLEDADAIKTTVEDAKESITKCADEYMKHKVENVVPTGVTPARKVYEYSRNIPQPPNEDDVLLKFREKIEEEDSQEEEEEDVLNQEINETDGSNSASRIDSVSNEALEEPNLDQSITIPDVGGVPFFKKDKHRRGKIHPSSLKQPSRVPLRPVHNINN